MKCDRCHDYIAAGEECSMHGQQLCEDCYIEAVQRPKTCDVAAVYSAKKHRESTGQTGSEGLTPQQKEIYLFIKEQGKVKAESLAQRYNLQKWELERIFTVLRHCELVKGRKEGDQLYFLPFEE